MKKKMFILAAACCCLLGGQALAQERPERPGAPADSVRPHREHFAEVPNPEKAARAETDRLKEALQLTDKQYKKVYKLLLKEQKERLEAFAARPPRGEGRPGMGPRGDRPPMGGGGFPSDMQGVRPPMGDERPAPRPDRAAREEEMKKKAAKRDKKMKKILTDEQYLQWKALPPARH